MTYTKQTWVDGPAGVPGATPITADRLNHIENGIGNLVGATVDRPSAATAGAGTMYYDTTLGKPVWSNGSAWKDAAGTTA